MTKMGEARAVGGQKLLRLWQNFHGCHGMARVGDRWATGGAGTFFCLAHRLTGSHLACFHASRPTSEPQASACPVPAAPRPSRSCRS